MKLRARNDDWYPFVAALCKRRDVESAGIVLAEPLEGSSEVVLIGREFLTVPDDGYLVRRRDQLRIAPLAINRMIRRARDEGLAILTVHTHPGTIEPWFSLADDAGDRRLMPSLYVQTPGPHGSLVLAGNTGKAIGRVWLPDGTQAALRLTVVGPTLDLCWTGSSPDGEKRHFERQELALGVAGQATLRSLRVAIVGLGGTGSLVLMQLAHLGVGQITLVEGDLVEASNVSRIAGATVRDVGSTKVDVAVRYVHELGLGTEVRALRGHLGRDVAASVLGDCDVVFSCVDQHTPRAILNRLSYDRLVPMIDMGSAFRVDSTGRVQSGAGRVVVVGPGRPCLCCWEHIDPDRLRIEALSDAERAGLQAEGYISGADVAQPSVIAFNTSVAGFAVVEFLRMVTGFAGTDDPPCRLAFDFLSGTVRRTRLAGHRDCVICSTGRALRTDTLPTA